MLALAVVVCGFLMNIIAADYSYLKITTEADDAIYVALAEKPTATVTADGVTVSTADESFSFIFSAKPCLQFSETSSVKAIKEEGSAIFTYFNGVVEVSNLPAESLVSVFDIEGREVTRGRTDANGAWSVSASTLSPAVYIIKTAKTTSKIIVK